MAPRPAASPQAAGRGLRVAVRGASRRPGPLRPVEWAPCRRSRHLRTSAACSASGRRAKRSPSSPTSASTRCSTAARRRPASRSATGPASSSTRTSAWSPRSSTSRRWPACAATSRSGTRRYSTTGVVHLGERAADVPRPPRTGHARIALGPQRQPGQHRRAGRAGRPSSASPTPARPPTPRWSPSCSPADPDLSVEAAALTVLPTLRGAFSFVFMDEDTLYAARDAHGVRPLVLGRLERGWVVASETAALDIVGASVRPRGRAGRADRDRRATACARAGSPRRTPKGCLFEYVYLARPDTTIAGRNVYAARVEIGRRLAREHPVEADLVIPVPESGTPAAIGYAEESGIPYGARPGQERVRRAAPSSSRRQTHPPARHPAQAQPAARRACGASGWSSWTTRSCAATPSGRMVRMLREAGALEVHVRISSPPVKWPCFYGIDFATRAELIANGLDVEGIRRSIGADSLGYVSLDGLVARHRAAGDAAVPGLLRRRVPDPAAAPEPDRQARAGGHRAVGHRRLARPLRGHPRGARAHRPGPALTGAETTRARSSARRTPAWPVRLLADRGMPAAVAGEVVPGTGPARVVGTHSGWR